MTIQANNTDAREGSRIAKVMARAGLCSRRDAEQWIAEGRVSVNGEVLTSPAFNVSEADDVRVDGEPLRAAERTRLFLFHKSRGLVTTAKDPEGRATIFDALPEDLPRVVAVGRLDINTEGLLLLTNDGGLSRVLELPSTGWLRRYRVRAHGEVTQEQLDSLREGITIEGINYLGIEAKFERQQGSNVWITMGLREGKNREIKRVLEHMGLSVNRLIRVSFGPFELADLPEGELFEVRTRVLRDQLGPKLAKKAGANFEEAAEVALAPVAPPPPRGDRPRRAAGHPGIPPETPTPPRRDAPPPKRKHVSVLRAEARDEAAGPRKRIDRSATADRKGREVKVERISFARPVEEAPRPRSRRDGTPSARAPREAGFGPRAEGRFGKSTGERPPSLRRDDAAGARPSRSGGADRPPRREFTPRPARSEDGERPPRREFTPRPARSEAGERPPRREFTPRPARSEAGGRPPRREFAAQPARGEAGERPPRREHSAKPPRGAGGAKPPRSGPPRGKGPRKPRG